MSKRFALILYFLLLVVAICTVVVDIPATVTISLGKDKVCASLPHSVCSLLPLPKTKDILLTRPQFNVNVAGIKLSRDLEVKQGLDIAGGTQVTLAADMSQIAPPDRDKALQTAQQIIERRINLYGVSEATVQTAKSTNEYRLVAEIPGISDSSQAVQLIGSTAQLDFREYKPTSGSGKIASTSGVLVSDFKPTDLSGKDLANASVAFDSQTGKPYISLQFTPDGTKKFAEITSRNVGKPLAIFIDDYPITIPVVSQAITTGQAQISGDFSTDDANNMSIALNAGALPVPISVIGQQTVDATLGNQAVQRSVQAILIGIGIIFLFMILLYDLKGLIAVASLLLYGLITLALYKLIPITLSLAGIAGFLLSMGMAVDTNILVFERLKEEERKSIKRTREQLLNQAFSRAWNSIRDANFTTLITCFVLYNPFEWEFLNRSGMVRGFALTLALGIFLNILCGMGVTRVLMTMFYSPLSSRRRQSADEAASLHTGSRQKSNER
ncbi:protein translocase subunit SecD [Candidatus Cerribacteria bacterium 'Amazon FNV 2010 28 9']|uniref:Protein translocase subunit SecD n=1 Tax=Candidatus Cerribacteria bacterium 'Amazon FNV 2010 28 9' TaxID=2081795 RepID=A0A317JQV5_9BACT|nr:MAG: protein translocase subunit SecD [Candidatus Cerribacteria bacterium 'Amazon FNV 2010 28 9']